MPGDSNEKFLFQTNIDGGVGFYVDIAVSEELLVKLIRILKKYLLDDSVKTVDITSRALKVSMLQFWCFSEIGTRLLTFRACFVGFDMCLL